MRRSKNPFLLSTGAVMTVNACSNALFTCLHAYEFLPRSFVSSCGSSIAHKNGRESSYMPLSRFLKKPGPLPPHEIPTSSATSLRPKSSKKSMRSVPRQPSLASLAPCDPAHVDLHVVLCNCK